ncbi:hypothetical protein [uncultured Devosia sp.]|uniref:hypothetical protein n=1 Tax=uncultured Devosia sp. TaxID=211434 RepID=UPI0026111273|nr:hypothetical protein [uncultured Devosia sp.]
MFLSSRFVIVDDKQEHLSGIKAALDQLRLDCHTKLYDVETIGDWERLPGVRILFMDKNLRPGLTMGGGPQSAFAAIAEVIEKLISPQSGPYGLILWAEDPEMDALKAFLQERLAVVSPLLMPVFFAELKKGDYIDLNGNVHNAEKLKADILAALEQSPQMKALFSWETDVMAASDAVLRSIVDLVPENLRVTDGFGQELGKVFYRLSQAGAGINKALDDPRAAINRVLVPILADRILEHDPEANAGDKWRDALVNPGNQNATIQVKAAVNTAIHLSHARSPGSVPTKPTDLGAVVDFPFEDAEAALEQKFGLSKAILMDDKFFGVSEQEWPNIRLRLIQIGAACDHAQPNKGPLLYALAIEWPFTNDDGFRTGGATLHQGKKTKDGEQLWYSPLLLVGPDKRAGKITAILNCTMAATRDEAANWTVAFRMRDELISMLTQAFARYISRPGIVELS